MHKKTQEILDLIQDAEDFWLGFDNDLHIDGETIDISFLPFLDRRRLLKAGASAEFNMRIDKVRLKQYERDQTEIKKMQEKSQKLQHEMHVKRLACDMLSRIDHPTPGAALQCVVQAEEILRKIDNACIEYGKFI